MLKLKYYFGKRISGAFALVSEYKSFSFTSGNFGNGISTNKFLFVCFLTNFFVIIVGFNGDIVGLISAKFVFVTIEFWLMIEWPVLLNFCLFKLRNFSPRCKLF